MRKIIRDRTIVEDHWQHVADDEPLPDGDIIVSHARWREERAALVQHEGKVGVRINGDISLDTLIGDLDRLPLIALEFPAFKDGRCYSHARVLRERHGYPGELRAVGDVLRDQLAYMARVGINAFEIREDRSIEDALQAFSEFSGHYQLDPRGRIPLELRRRQRQSAAAAAS
ncbi:DUF934 domain-containing protein [Aquisalimonas sp.]|uniref:DUF934 domain-containing protein n=1 Tax=Aquisalimonas sp. TaxID=1872621 RepID=UPI0025BA92B0|nr:DUF934 domain-containing protein [Aquisalimonas sp.]